MKLADAISFIKAASPDDQMYLAIMTVINDAYDEETIHALAPSVSNDDRAYNCGRASAILDAKTLLDETMNE